MGRIKINVSYDEETNTIYHRYFTVVKTLPKVGSDFDGGKVVGIEEVRKDPEQPSSDVDFYDAFCVRILPEGEEEPEKRYIAISSTEPVVFATLAVLDFPVHDKDLADRILLDAVKDRYDLCLHDLICWTDDPIGDVFGMDAETYREAVITSVLGGPPARSRYGDRDAMIEADMEGYVRFYARMPYYFDDDTLEICVRDVLDPAPLPSPGSIKEIPEKVFRRIVEDALGAGGNWRDEEGLPAWFDLISPDTERLVKYTDTITDVMFMPFKDFVEKAGLSQAEFARKFYIPIRTVQNWSTATPGNARECKPYLRLLFAEKLGFFD